MFAPDPNAASAFMLLPSMRVIVTMKGLRVDGQLFLFLLCCCYLILQYYNAAVLYAFRAGFNILILLEQNYCMYIVPAAIIMKREISVLFTAMIIWCNFTH